MQHYFKIAFRHLMKYKGQVLFSIVGLSIGILSFTACTYIVRLLVTLNNQFSNYEQMAEVKAKNEDGNYWSQFSLEQIRTLENTNIFGIESLAVFRNVPSSVFSFRMSDGTDNPFDLNIVLANEAFFDVYSVRLIEGHTSVLFKQPNSVVISETIARKIYNKESPVGKIIQQGKELYTIRGVIQDIPTPNNITGFFNADIIHCMSEADDMPFPFQLMVLLKPGISLKTINEEIERAGISFLKYTDSGEESDMYYIPVVSVLNEGMSGFKGFLNNMLPIGIGFLVLLTGLINFFTLNIGSFYNRIRELSLRKVTGATHYNLFLQLFTELFIVILLTSLFTLCLTEILIPLLNNSISEFVLSTSGTTKKFSFMKSSRVIVYQLQYLAAILLVCAVVAWIAIGRLLRMPSMKGIRGGNIKGTKHRLRNTMLGIQFFISLLFLGAASVLYIQSGYMQKGFIDTYSNAEKERTLIVPLTAEQLKGIEHEVARQLYSTGLIEDYMLVGEYTLPLSRAGMTTTTASGKEIHVARIQASPDFASFFHIPMIQGEKAEYRHTALINKKLFDLLESEENQYTLLSDSISFHIKGVMEDANIVEVSDGTPLYFLVEPVGIPRNCYLRSKPGQEKALRKHIDKVLRQWIPDTLPIVVSGFMKRVGVVTSTVAFIQDIALLLALICILITTLGMYAAITLDTQHRQKEVAIRKINGATFKEISLLFGKLYVSIFIVTSVFALPILWLGTQFLLQGFVLQYNFNTPFFWLTLLCIEAAIIAITIAYRLYKISRLNPAEAIKTE